MNVIILSFFLVASSCNHLTAIDCSSRDFEFARCSIPGAGEITDLSVTRKYSRSSCRYDWSYGHQGGQVWVNHGCRAQFAVCYNTVSNCINYFYTRCETYKMMNEDISDLVKLYSCLSNSE